MTTYRNASLGTVMVLLLGAVSPAAQSTTDYLIGPQDVLSVTVWNQSDLTGLYTVEADGGLTFPLVGRVVAGGRTVRQFQTELTRLLADGFFRNPQVTVSVREYRSQRIFVVGEVRSPGTYPLDGGMTLIEALATAGSTTDQASHEALIVQKPQPARPGSTWAPSSGPPNAGPTLPEHAEAEDATVVSVDIEALQSGRAAQEVTLRDGDTVFVPRAETVFVFGEVNAPGEFPIRRGATVLQALALAGGVTDYGATNRIKVIRIIDGKQRELKLELNDLIRAGDTIVVPQRFI